MGNISCKFAPHPLILCFLRNIENEDDRTTDFLVYTDRISKKLIIAALHLYNPIVRLPLQCQIQTGLQILVSAQGKNILMDALLLFNMKKSKCLFVDRQNHSFVRNDQTILHIFRDGIVLVLLFFQCLYLLRNLVVLLVDSRKKRRYLFIYIVLQRMLQIQTVQRSYEMLRLSFCKKYCNRKNTGKNQKKRDETVTYRNKYTVCRSCHTQHIAI